MNAYQMKRKIAAVLCAVMMAAGLSSSAMAEAVLLTPGSDALSAELVRKSSSQQAEAVQQEEEEDEEEEDVSADSEEEEKEAPVRLIRASELSELKKSPLRTELKVIKAEKVSKEAAVPDLTLKQDAALVTPEQDETPKAIEDELAQLITKAPDTVVDAVAPVLETLEEKITGVTITEKMRASAADQSDASMKGTVSFTGLRDVVAVLNDSQGKDLEFKTLHASEDGSAVSRSFEFASLAPDTYTIEFYFKNDGTNGLPPTKTASADLTVKETTPEPEPEAFSKIEASIAVNDAAGTFAVTITGGTAGEPMVAYVDGLTQDQTVTKGETATFVVGKPGTYALAIEYMNSTDSALMYEANVTVNGSGTEPTTGKVTDVQLNITNTAEGESSGAIAGTVSFTGEEGMIVRLYEGDTQIAQTTLAAGAQGQFSFGNLSAGEYAVYFYFESGDAPVYAASPIVRSIRPQAKEISAAATAGVGRIDVTVSDASALPVAVTLKKDGAAVKNETIAAGVGSVAFEGLPAGTYSVTINYDPAQDGVSAVVKSDLVVTEKTAGIVITGVKGGVSQLTVTGTAQPGMQVIVTTEPAAAASVYAMTDASGKFTAILSCSAGVYTKVTAQYSGDTTSAVIATGSFTVTAPISKPELKVDPVDTGSTTVSAKTTPGVLVEIKTSDFTQKVTADSSGIVRFSLPHTYAKDTAITFIVYYGEGNAQSFTQSVIVSEAPAYTTLKKGDEGAAVERLTARLKELGYLSKVTDKFDDKVKTAVSLFQSTNGLDADGKADVKTQELLFSVSARPYGSATVYPTLVRGDRGLSLIYTLQQRLKDLGYYTIKVDGIFGSGTQRAVRDFQKMNGLSVTGKADDATQRLLYSSAAKPAHYNPSGYYKTLSRSSKYQSAVVPLQRRLKALGYYSGSIDGYFGSQTYRAVRNFQKRNGIDKTGKADPYTQQVLFSSAAKPASGSSSSSSSSSTGYRLLYWGCKGSDVKRLQNALIDAGYKKYVRTADGIYGQWTYDAVRAYQKDHGLSVDGIAGKNTQNSLYGTNY